MYYVSIRVRSKLNLVVWAHYISGFILVRIMSYFSMSENQPTIMKEQLKKESHLSFVIGQGRR